MLWIVGQPKVGVISAVAEPTDVVRAWIPLQKPRQGLGTLEFQLPHERVCFDTVEAGDLAACSAKGRSPKQTRVEECHTSLCPIAQHAAHPLHLLNNVEHMCSISKVWSRGFVYPDDPSPCDLPTRRRL